MQNSIKFVLRGVGISDLNSIILSIMTQHLEKTQKPCIILCVHTNHYYFLKLWRLMVKLSSFLYFTAFGIKTVLFRKKLPILGTVIVTDKCNLHCKHCSVNNITAVVHPYKQIRQEMQQLYEMGVWSLKQKVWAFSLLMSLQTARSRLISQKQI